MQKASFSALRIVPGSHSLGRLTAEAIQRVHDELGEVTVPVSRGGGDGDAAAPIGRGGYCISFMDLLNCPAV